MSQKLFRSFTAEFREHMTKHAAWPDEAAVNALRGGDMNHGAYKALQDGNVRSNDYVIAIITCIMQKSNFPEVVHTRQAMFDYLHHLDSAQVESMEAKQIADLVCDDVEFGRKDTNIKDAFQWWLDLAFDMFKLKRPSIEHVRPCNDAKDVRQAIEWMYIEAGRAVGGKRLSRQEATCRAESFLKIDFETYLSSAIKWHDRIPWTVAYVIGQRKPIGMCLNLPVPENIYEAVKRGERSSSYITAQELESPSSQLIAEGLALRPREQCDRSFGDSKAMLYAVLCQQARLTDIPYIGWETPMRLLSFSATKANTRRLKWVRYKPVGTTTPETGLGLYERVFDVRNEQAGSALDVQLLGIWWRVQVELRKKFG